MTVSELLFFVGFKSTSPTVACAIGNMVPALTFVIAAALKIEAVGLLTPAGQAKVIGTVVCIGGSMIMPFYKGPLLKIWPSPIHWLYAEHTTAAAASHSSSSGLGDALIIFSCVAWAVWLIMQVLYTGRSSLVTIPGLMMMIHSIGCLICRTRRPRNSQRPTQARRSCP
jgi:drug/metabolite transporter (DMT)-like permease